MSQNSSSPSPTFQRVPDSKTPGGSDTRIRPVSIRNRIGCQTVFVGRPGLLLVVLGIPGLAAGCSSSHLAEAPNACAMLGAAKASSIISQSVHCYSEAGPTLGSSSADYSTTAPTSGSPSQVPLQLVLVVEGQGGVVNAADADRNVAGHPGTQQIELADHVLIGQRDSNRPRGHCGPLSTDTW